VLVLTDARSGRPTPVGRRATRLLVEAAGDHGTAARAYVVADVVRRVLELRGARVLTTAATGATEGAATIDAAVLSALNVPSPEPSRPDDPRPDVVVTARSGAAAEADADTACLARVGRVRGHAPGEPTVVGDAVGATEPLATRLLLLAGRYPDDVALDPAATAAAGERLTVLRRRVAAWAEHPSAALPRGVVDRFVAAIEDDLDVPGALRILDDCAADDGVPDGAKFELFAYADRVLAVDLVRDVGRR
jgi:hypothetical protein